MSELFDSAGRCFVCSSSKLNHHVSCRLCHETSRVLLNLFCRYIVSTEKQQLKSVLNQPILEPQEAGCSFLQFEDYWIKKGSLEPQSPDNYILTKSVRKNLKDLVRVVSIGKLPVLLQVRTSCPLAVDYV